MSRSQIKRFGRRCLTCGIRKRSVKTRSIPHSTVVRKGKVGTEKPTTLLCDECASKFAAA